LADQSFIDRLFDAGLDGIFLSIYSADEDVADRERGRLGLWGRAVEGLLRLRDTRRYLNPSFLIVTQAVLSRNTVLGAADLLRLTTRLGSDLQVFSYLEGDFEAEYTPTVDQIAEFRRDLVPQMIAGTRLLHPLVRPVARWRLGMQFSNARLSDEEYAAGIYKPDAAMQRACRIPNRFILVLPDGDVHPCNLVEYDHEPVMGNFKAKADLRAIWEGDRWREFRREHHHRCQQCPMGLHNWVPLHITPMRAYPFLRCQV
jgi:radical SAM protein with 4Fe4S-binding SPASM domain